LNRKASCNEYFWGEGTLWRKLVAFSGGIFCVTS
jgi:hypothetical protein